ncbi:hypothetical protein ACFQ0K_11490 [Nocardioides caeni]|uniref:Htaa domain-containing protein n=1 Tax=Nocardioides caeni TaxID=574700 RepID=A0A4S8NMW1_9ACTN|nr:hypothetical protein [Nocardioides caeni]THV17925.1 hypothetical protein E9934_05585 [Nocardioides caeni]
MIARPTPTAVASWRRVVAVLLAVGAAVALAIGLVGALTPASSAAEPTGAADATTTEPTEPTEPTDPTESTEPTDPTESTEPTEPPDEATELTDAVLRWGVTREANTLAHDGVRYSFPGAGTSEGNGGEAITAAQWRQRVGDVSIEKGDPALGGYRPATWADHVVGAGGFSDHQIVFAGGTGSVDPAAGTARVAWQGSATIFFYSGASLFSLTDPVLEIGDGRGVVTATLSGFKSSQSGGVWSPAPVAKDVVVATFSALGPDRWEDWGFTAAPDYRGVRVADVAVPQVRGGDHWGAFPQPFVSYLDMLGSGAFWYSTGGSQPSKVALPVTVQFGADEGVVPQPSPQPTDLPTVDNSAPPPPNPDEVVTVPAPGAPVPVAAAAPPAATAGQVLARPMTEMRLTAATPPSGRGSDGGSGWAWWGASALLLAAAALLLIPPAGVSATRRAG